MLDWLEQCGESKSQATSSFAYDVGKAIIPLFLEEPTADEILAGITELLGDTSADTSDGRLSRQLPMRHPLFQSLYCSSIQSLQGIGSYEKIDAEPVIEGDVVLPFYALWDWYEFLTEFAPRQYAVEPDSNINIKSSSWYDDTGALQSFDYAEEWLRYTHYDQVPSFEALTAQNGQFVFEGTSCANLSAFVAMPKMYLPNQVVKFTWHQIPYRYVYSTNSYFDRWIGRINQNAWYEWNAGELLYLGFNLKRYTAVGSTSASPFFTGVLGTRKMCDIEFTFLQTKRSSSDLKTAPSNRNFIQKGHNLLPWLVDRQFHFALTNPALDPSKLCSKPSPTPSFLSFPLEVMFTDPDAEIGVD